MYKIEGNKLITEDRTFTFTREIGEIIEWKHLLIVRLNLVGTSDGINNVYAIQGDRILWQVQDPIHYNPAFATLEAHLGGYADLEIYNKDPSLLMVGNFRGGTFLVNPENGAIVGQGPWVK